MNMKMTLHKQQGLTLIELMIALVISLLILAGLLTVYQSNKDASRTHDGLVQVQENGRFALDFLIRDIRMAGFPAINTALHNQVSGFDGVGILSDTLVIRNTTGTDCLGNVMVPVVTNTYTIANTVRNNRLGNPIPALFCNGQELVEGIENMQISYGIDTDTDRDGVPNQYVNAAGVTTTAPANGWDRVVSIRISLLATSVNPSLNTVSNRTYRMSGMIGALGPFNDNIMRREYTSTASLENYLYNF